MTTPNTPEETPVAALGRKWPRRLSWRHRVLIASYALLAIAAGLAAAAAFLTVFVGSGLADALGSPPLVSVVGAVLVCGHTTWNASHALARSIRNHHH
ncbi:hypothetical protein [Streptomyces sp. NBC_01207]|uniref:hypothetical protein n=1 Tax=Streptomyces sp. NBC_01207 TaxID=2903772 RepID=UPI002E1094AD|nr:hypothetical protein OG457_27275 [Streptomyces sp. NBC_01207]